MVMSFQGHAPIIAHEAWYELIRYELIRYEEANSCYH